MRGVGSRTGSTPPSGQDPDGKGGRAPDPGEPAGLLEIDVRVECHEQRVHRGVAVADKLADAPFVDAVLLGREGPLCGGVDHVGETAHPEMSYITVRRALVGPLAMRETSS